MSDAIDRAAVRDEVEYRLRTAAAHYRSCGKHDTDPGDFLDREIEAMTERLVGLLAPAPLREEWGTRFGGVWNLLHPEPVDPVDALAEELYTVVGEGRFSVPSWDNLTDHARENYRRMAKHVIERKEADR